MTARQDVKPVLTIGAYPEARYVRVPCNYMGMLFDHGRVSAYAIHLTTIKAS